MANTNQYISQYSGTDIDQAVSDIQHMKPYMFVQSIPGVKIELYITSDEHLAITFSDIGGGI